MKKIKVFETFTGIGSQKKALEILKTHGIIDYEVVATSEWDMCVNIAYNAIHHKDKNIAKKISDEEINIFLANFTHSFDSKKPITSNYLNSKSRIFREKLYSAYKNANNLGSILNITGDSLIKDAGDIDLITYSFPCQDLSVAGSFHGFNQGMAKGSNTRSGLLWEVERILEDLEKLNKKPKYLLLENVKNMVSERHKDDYKMWLKRLSLMGYNTQTYILKGSSYGIPQARDRVYALSILNVPSFKDTFNETKQIIEKNKPLDISRDLKINKSMNDILKVDYTNLTYKNEAKESTPNRTPSRLKMFKDNPKLFTNNKIEFDLFNDLTKSKYIKNESGYFLNNSRTLTTKQDRHPNAGVVDLRNSLLDVKDYKKINKAKYRFITPRESYMLMGFSESDFDKVNNLDLFKKEIFLRQAGNSIVVNVLVAIFNHMEKF